jgi:hypothetical protein
VAGRHDSASPLTNWEAPVKVKLAALWASTMFVYAYVDILSFYKPGTVTDILAGRVWEFEITQTWALTAMALMTIPAVMVFAAVALPARANRRTNLIVGALYLLVSAGNPIGEDWAFLYLGAVVEVALLATVLRLAWKWPRDLPAPPGG